MNNSTKKNMLISISVLTYNRLNLLRELLLSLKELHYPIIELIVVDNHSTDGTDEMIRKEFPFVNHIRTEENIGVTARNLGLKNATGEIVITLDDDVFGIDDNSLESLNVLFRERPLLGAVNFKVTNHINGQLCNWVHHCPPESYANCEFPTYEITEGAVAFRREAVEKAGYYPDNFFISHEGPDLAFRIMKFGFDVIYSNVILVKHRHSNLGRKDWYIYYYDTRNQFLLAVRNFPILYAIKYLARGLTAMFIYSMRDGFVRYWVRGVCDGVKSINKEIKNRQVLEKNLLSMINDINSKRPSIIYYVKNKIFKRGVRF